MQRKLAFSLAEIMITLTVIGIITAVIIPVAINSKPDENVMKFKKAHNTLYQVISELVNSDKYYLNGDLGIKPDGSLTDDANYFTKAISDIVSTKSFNNITLAQDVGTYFSLAQNKEFYIDGTGKIKITDCNTNYNFDITPEDIEEAKNSIDKRCLKREEAKGEEITTIDNIEYFQTGVASFGQIGYVRSAENKITFCSKRFLSPPNETAFLSDQNGFDIAYKIFCIDVDGFNKGEDPFGYGIRADGKIMTGARADSWLEKSIQGE